MSIMVAVMPNKISQPLETLPQWAAAIKHRRLMELDITQEEVAARSGEDVLHQLQVSRLERGLTHPTKSLSTEELFGLLRGLNWTPEEFMGATGLELPGFRRNLEPGERVLPAGYEYMPVLGSASLGKPVEFPAPRKKYRRTGAVFEVEGQSMTRPDGSGIRDGQVVFVDTSMTTPVESGVFLIHLEGDGFTVKRIRRVNGKWWMFADNPDPKYKAMPLTGHKIIGFVYGQAAYNDVR